MSCLEKLRNNGIDLENEFTAEWVSVIHLELRITITMRRLLVSEPDATFNLHCLILRLSFDERGRPKLLVTNTF